MRILNTLLSAVFLYNQAARAEIVPLDLILDADSEEVHYVRGWLEAPAVIDITKVKFLTSPVPKDWEKTDDEINDMDENDDEPDFSPVPPPTGGGFPTPTGGGGGGGRPSKAPTSDGFPGDDFDNDDFATSSPGNFPSGGGSGGGGGTGEGGENMPSAPSGSEPSFPTGGFPGDGDVDAPSAGPLDDNFDGGDGGNSSGGNTGGDGGLDGGDGGSNGGGFDGGNNGGDGGLDGGDGGDNGGGFDGGNNGGDGGFGGGLDGGDGGDNGGGFDGGNNGGDGGFGGDGGNNDSGFDGGNTGGDGGGSTGGGFDGGNTGGDGGNTGGGLDGEDGGSTGGNSGGDGGSTGGGSNNTGGNGGFSGGNTGGGGGSTGGNGGNTGGNGGFGGLNGGNTGGGGGGTPTSPPTPFRRKLQGLTQKLHFVLFSIPDNCKEDMFGNCDWTALGVGATDEMVEGDISYCCSEDTASRNICEEENIGKLIVDPVLFTGEERFLEVPQTVNTPFEFPEDESVFHIKQKGDYVLLMGNCLDDGLDVLEMGSMEWKAENRGYVPGHLYGLMLFYAALTVYYFVLAFFYKCGMRIFQDAAIPIQKYIFATIVLGFLELLCRAIDLGYWDVNGQRSVYVLYASLGLGVLKRGISNSLGVMVAKGWGIVRESLGLALAKIIMLGLIYTGLTGFRDFSLIIAEEDVEKISVTEETELFDIALILTLVIMVLDLIFYFWILDSLNATTDYLRNMNQTSKLRRHLRLRCLMLTSMTIAAAWLVFTIVDKVMGGILRRDQKWFLDGVMQLNYTFIMTGVAILWRPNANAKDYAMQMEIPTMGGDDENDLELSCVVPSAGEYDDGNDPDHRNGIRANMGQYS